MNEQHAREQVVLAGKQLLDSGLIARTWGNVSCRTAPDRFVITPSGLGYEQMLQEDVVPIDLATMKWEGSRKPSSEKGVHAAAYRIFPEAGFVIHTHQMYATTFSLAGIEKLELNRKEQENLAGVGAAKYGLPGTKTLMRNVSSVMANGNHCVLMGHHGAVIIGKDRDEAFARASLLESVCQRNCKGQPDAEAVGDDSIARALIEKAQDEYPFIRTTIHPAVAKAAEVVDSVPAQLDDMAQMIGARIRSVNPEPMIVLKELEKTNVVLVRGVGAICRASNDADCRALCLLTEKACVSYLHTRALNQIVKLPLVDTWLMRFVYLNKYAKLIDQKPEKQKNP